MGAAVTKIGTSQGKLAGCKLAGQLMRVMLQRSRKLSHKGNTGSFTTNIGKQGDKLSLADALL